MTTVLAALAPILALILLGYLLMRTGLVAADLWGGVEKLCYFVFFPALIFQAMAKADFAALPVVELAGALFLSLLVMTAIVFALKPWMAARFGVDGPAFTSVMQGATRWNTFSVLALVGQLHGPTGVSAVSIAMAAMIPYLNVMNVTVLVAHAGGGRPKLGDLAATLARNPLILATLGGLAANLLGLRPAGVAADFLALLAAPALALGLLLVGAGLDPARALEVDPPMVVASVLKLLVMPLLMGGLALGFGLRGLPVEVAVLCGSVHTAAAAYVLARQLGGDAPLMARIVAFQTLASFVTMPLFVLLAQRMSG